MMNILPVRVSLRFVILLILPCLFTRAQGGHAQISPGELSSPHAELEGISNCSRCHEGKGKLSDERCLDCHGEIAIQLERKDGFHWKGIERKQRTQCGRCHAEHNGREYELFYWEGGIDRFDHGRTDYPLVGKHGKIKCRDCHRQDRIVQDLSHLNREMNLDRTFLGLDPECGGCHEDIHRAQFPGSCDTCHGMDIWRPAERFAHERSRYPLTGKHMSVSCEKCHREADGGGSEGGIIRHIRYRGLWFDDCSNCHDYRHRTELGGSCSGCHTTDGWRSFVSNDFDHGKTRFQLRGRHRDVTCDSCHREGLQGAGLRFERCVDCHRDIHRAGFCSERYAGRCEPCHGEDRFIPSTYGLEDHDQSPFPLEGAHRAIPCTACHKREEGEEQIVFRIEEKDCESCHRDPHRGQFPVERYRDCSSCHGPDRWDHLLFDHQKTVFPLDGRHVNVRCEACHPAVRVVDIERFVRYTPLDRSCRSCHAGESEIYFNEEDRIDREEMGN